MKKYSKVLFLVVLFFAVSLSAGTGNWPKEIELKKHTLIIYQPQPQELKDNHLKILAAISVESQENPQAIFGAMWFDAEVAVDKSSNRANLDNFKLTKLQFANDKNEDIDKLRALLESRMPQLNFDISYHKLLSTLEVQGVRERESLDIKNDAPKIIVTEKPSVLISIDGEPRLKPLGDNKLYRVLNTPYTIIMDSQTSIYYLNADVNTWYTSKDAVSGYKVDKNIPQDVKEYEPKSKEEDVKQQTSTVPEVIVSTVPTELISCDGKAEFTPIKNTSLMYVSNTESDLFMEMKTQKYYLLLSGRWYESKGLQKKWNYIKSTDLPSEFAKIPADSESSNVLYAVSGTIESKDAVIDAMIPQTASVNRKTATLNVEYDGKPQYKNIEGTSLRYITNTQTPVIQAGKHYYACDNAIWFESDFPDGEWRVATTIDDEIYSIPPKSPLYNITFVKIYKVTDDTVDVGYTAGYTNTYVYNTTIVYGTGYHYTPWYGSYYYPYPSTWGYHLRWSPYYGWGIGMSYSSGPFTFMIGGGGWYGRGYWGPAPYYRYGHGYRRGYHNGYRQGYINGRLSGKRPELGKNTRPSIRDRNLYNNKGNKDRVKKTQNKMGGANRFQSAKVNNTRQNNVFADKKGNIHRKNADNWQKREASGWDRERKMNTSKRQNLDKSFSSRNRSDNFSRGSFSGGRSNFGGRSGGFGGRSGGFSGGGFGGGRRR